MAPWFEISVDERRSLLTITLGGFFSLPEIERLAVERGRAFPRLRSEPNMHVTLIDVCECKIQSQDVIARFGQVMTDGRYRAKRVAFVAAGSLAKMQLRRLTADLPRAKLFETAASAKAWLFEPLEA